MDEIAANKYPVMLQGRDSQCGDRKAGFYTSKEAIALRFRSATPNVETERLLEAARQTPIDAFQGRDSHCGDGKISKCRL